MPESEISWENSRLCRIRALASFTTVGGDVGGYIESECNLSHGEKAWIFNDAKASCRAKVLQNAVVGGNAVIKDDAVVGLRRHYLVGGGEGDRLAWRSVA